MGRRAFSDGTEDRIRSGLRGYMRPSVRALFGEDPDKDGLPESSPESECRAGLSFRRKQADVSVNFLVALPEFCSFGVVVEVESQGKILTAELTGQRRKRIGTGNATPRGAIQSDVAGTGSQLHASDPPILENGKLYRYFSPLHEWGSGDFRDEVVPILPYVVQYAREVRTKVHAHGIAENV